VARRERQHHVAVVDPPPRVDGDDAIAVPVEGEAHVRVVVDDGPGERLRRGRAAAVVDVLAVGRVEEREHLGAGLREDQRSDPVGRAVRAVEHDLHAVEGRRDAPEEVLVLLHQTARVPDEADAAFGRARQPVIADHLALDLVFDRVRKLQAAVVEELDAVVRRGVVRRADDRAGHEGVRAREVREAGRRDVPRETHVDADRAEPRRERSLEHAAAPPRVTADDDRVPAAAEHVARGAPEAQRELGRELEIRDAADAVGAEQAAHFDLMVSVTRLGCTLCALAPGGTRTLASTVYVPGGRPAASTTTLTWSAAMPTSVGCGPATVTVTLPGSVSATVPAARFWIWTASRKGRVPASATTVTFTVASVGCTSVTPPGRTRTARKLRVAVSPLTSTGAVSIRSSEAITF